MRERSDIDKEIAPEVISLVNENTMVLSVITSQRINVFNVLYYVLKILFISAQVYFNTI